MGGFARFVVAVLIGIIGAVLAHYVWHAPLWAVSVTYWLTFQIAYFGDWDASR